MSKINIVLFEPEIPPNTANIMRTCIGTKSALHLIHPLGFDLKRDYSELKRSSTNYIDDVELYEYDSIEEFLEKHQTESLNFITRYGQQSYDKIDYQKSVDEDKEIFLIFGKESIGLPKDVLEAYPEQTYRIPMASEMRSLNLSNCVALSVYELLRQSGFENLAMQEPHKENFLEKEKSE